MNPRYVFGFLLFTASLSAQMSVRLAGDVESPAPVGTMMNWNTTVTGATSPNLWYRYRTRKVGKAFQLVRDYSPVAFLAWTASENEGSYEVEVSVTNRDTGEETATAALIDFTSRVLDGQPSVNPTIHPLVFLYSAPECAVGTRMRIEFQSGADGAVHKTHFKRCTSGVSMNFFLAGLRPETEYMARYVVDDGTALGYGPFLTFTSGSANLPIFEQTKLEGPADDVTDQLFLGSSLGVPTATNLNGKPVWYANSDVSYITRPEAGGYFWGVSETGLTAEDAGDPVARQVIRKFDLTGAVVVETNAARVNQHLAAMGRRLISGFHHEVRTLSDGRIAALASVEWQRDDVENQPGLVNILGDMIVVLDEHLNVVWTWDSFDHLDVRRAAILGEVCSTTANAGCGPHLRYETVNDWTHSNSIAETPDGNLLLSIRHQDWVVKIAYDNGNGDGHMIWKLGAEGDFRIESNVANPWFSHQHDASFLATDGKRLILFDNGNTRVSSSPGNSRGQIYEIDEENRVARLVFNVDLGVYSPALGSADQLKSGNYHFNAGIVRDPENPAGNSAYAFEVDSNGHIVYKAKTNTILYRSFRMTNIYTPD